MHLQYPIDLVNEEYTFGRGDECDYCFENHAGKKPPQFLVLSKTHFRLYRVRNWVNPESGKLWNKFLFFVCVCVQEKDKSDSSKYLVFIQDKRLVFICVYLASHVLVM